MSSAALRFAPGARVVASSRDVALLRLVGEQCALTQPQLARAMGRTVRTARWLRSRWERAGWVESGQLVPGWPPSMWLTARGQALASLDFRVWRPRLNDRIFHIAYAAEARLYVRGRHPDASWVCERFLMRRWRRDGLRVHRPDAEVVMPDRRTVAAEVELSAKGSARLARIAADLSAYAASWYFAPADDTEALAGRIKRAGIARCHVVPLTDPWEVT